MLHNGKRRKRKMVNSVARPTIFYLLFTLSAVAPAQAATWIIGYYSAGNGVQPISAIPWSKYTHITHFAAAPGVDATGSGNGTVELHYLTPAEITQIVASGHAAGKKVLVTVKDNDGHLAAFGQSTAPGMIATFVANVASFINTNGYDGVDFDWESNITVAQYNDFLARTRAALPGKIISVTGGNWGGLETVGAQSYANVDQINVMCYDMDFGSSFTWHNDALFQNGDAAKMTCDWRVRAYTSLGVPNAKLGIGIPFYGRRWTGTTLPLQSGGTQVGYLPYRSIVTDTQRWQDAYKKWDTTYSADYLSVTPLNEFISYNGTTSIKATVDWVNTQGFGGYMTFTTDYEYLTAQIGDARYPLSTALYSDVNGVTPPPPPPPTTSPCDVNGDGATNVADVQLEVNMALGISPCTNPSGTCTVASVQRVVNVALGMACVSP